MAEKKKDTKLGLSAKKADDFPEWYAQLVVASELVSYYKDVSGCYVLRPGAMAAWDHIRAWFDGEILKMGVQNAYFPLFVTEKALATEASHVEGFSAEVAWVTRSGDTELEVPLAIRPTSETVMYPFYKDWIRSHRDLPLRLNQWTNVVRWEFKDPTPFIRSREFLWQEGHCAYATPEEADVETRQVLELYARIYEELLAVPVVRGVKSEEEKFAGSKYSTSVECFIPGSGKGVQGGTSHNLGQNFSRMFNITFAADDDKPAGQQQQQQPKKKVKEPKKSRRERKAEQEAAAAAAAGDAPPPAPEGDEAPATAAAAAVAEEEPVAAAVPEGDALPADSNLKHPHQTSWGFTTRSIGVSLMIHGDDSGAVLPPRVAQYQAVLITIPNSKMGDEERARLLEASDELEAALRAAGVRVVSDHRYNYTPGWKYNHWELKGVPLRVEIGPRDLENGTALLVRRDTREKIPVARAEAGEAVPTLLERIQREMYARALAERDARVKTAWDWPTALDLIHAGNMVLAPWCDEKEVEQDIKDKGKAGEIRYRGIKTLCIPFDQPELPEGTPCFYTGKPAKNFALWGRSY